MTYKTESCSLIFANGECVDFEYPVKETVQIDNVIIVITNPPNDKAHYQNVFAFKTSGDFLWRINDVSLFYDGPSCAWVGAEINKDGELVLFNWCDTAVIVNPITGEVVRTWVSR
jgi:hypothetical protein